MKKLLLLPITDHDDQMTPKERRKPLVESPSLCDIFYHSLQSGRLLSEWKSGNDTPILKKKQQKELAENYRPIPYFYCIVSKILGRCIYTNFCHHIVHLMTPYINTVF